MSNDPLSIVTIGTKKKRAIAGLIATHAVLLKNGGLIVGTEDSVLGLSPSGALLKGYRTDWSFKVEAPVTRICELANGSLRVVILRNGQILTASRTDWFKKWADKKILMDAHHDIERLQYATDDGAKYMAAVINSIPSKSRIIVIDANTDLQQIVLHHSSETTSVAFLQDSKLLAVGDADGYVSLYRVSNGSLVKRWLPLPSMPDYPMQLSSANGDTLAIAKWSLALYKVGAAQEEVISPEFTNPVHGLLYVPHTNSCYYTLGGSDFLLGVASRDGEATKSSP